MTFERAAAFVMDMEGGYVNDPNDPGGETKYGISKHAYPNEDIPNLTRDQASAIYLRDYWTPCRCDLLPTGVDLLVFDAAVNQGKDRAVKMLQAAVHVAQDGVIGPDTVNAARGAGSSLLAEYAAQRMAAYGAIPQFARYGLGWARRLMKALVIAV